MRVAVLPGDNGGCGMYRMIMPAEAVQAARPDWEVNVYAPKGEVEVGINRHGDVVHISLDPLPDVMVLQRTGTPVLAGVAEFMMKNGVAVVADFDDAMWCIDRKNISWNVWNMYANRGKRQHWSWCDYVAKRVDLVTVTTPSLARHYGRHGRVEVINNYIPEKALSYEPWERTDDQPVVGWVGYTGTHPGDCNVSKPGILEAIKHGAIVRGIADAEGMAAAWGVKVEEIPPQKYGPDYFGAISMLDLIFVGLKDSPFNSCKSSLKVLEAAAAGVPSIASATAPHRTLARRFPLLTAASPAEWRDHAKRLITNPSELEDMKTRVQQAMKDFTIEAHAEEWAQAWERAYNRRNR